ncbi:MAG: carbon-nitrogen hydrolase family protein [Mycobacterium sp.]
MSDSTIRLSLAQVTSSLDPDDNLATIEAQAHRAAAAGSSLVVFPEAMMRRFGAPLHEVAEPLDGRWAEAVRKIADGLGVTIVAGMFTPADEARVRNTLLITGPGVDAHYDKIHLFDAFGFAESDTVAPGENPLTVTVGGLTVGFATCYDLRFPALFQKLGSLGAELIVVPASWGSGPGKVEQWSLLTRARALDATAYVAACGQADPTASGETVTGSAPLGIGHSVVCSPSGEVVGSLGAAPELLTVDVSASVVEEVRAKLPVLANRRIFD